MLSPFGRLKCHIQKWSDTNVNSSILDVIKNGYKLPFSSVPSKVSLRNNASARNDKKYVAMELNNLLTLGLVSNVSRIPNVVNPLTVAENTRGKKRLVLDCRYVNLHLHKYKFKYEDVGVARNLFKQGEYAFHYDLKSAYRHIDIFPEHRSYLGFYWNTKYYVFNVLPFGLSTAGLIFTKVLRHLVLHWRSRGINIIMYLDDGIATSSNIESTKYIANKVRSDLYEFGFIVSEEKSDWEPKQVIEWLGITFDLIESKLYLNQDKRKDIKDTIQTILDKVSSHVSARYFASIVGKIQSCSPAIGHHTSLMTKYCHMCIESKRHWDAYIYISDQAKNELKFWLDNIDILNGQPFIKKYTYTAEVCSDASEAGYGGCITDHDGSEAIGQWTRFESTKSSTWRELKAVSMVIQSLATRLRDTCVRWKVDNMNVIVTLKKGSMNEGLQAIALNIARICNI